MDLGKRILGKRAFNQLMKLTFYGQFVAGEDHIAIRPLIQKNQAFGVGSVLDYGVEEDISEEDGQKETEYASCRTTYFVFESRLFSISGVPWASTASVKKLVVQTFR